MKAFNSNLHTHTVFSDGRNTPEETVIAAIEKGFVSIGFSEHSPAPYVSDFAMKAEDAGRYMAEIRGLKEKYAGKIEVYLGIESDMLLPFDKTGLDYVIGSVHDLRDDAGVKYTIDWLPEVYSQAIEVIGGGDVKVLVRRYYAMVEDMLTSYKPDIIGHADIIVKVNTGGRFFDENSTWYKREQEYISEKIAASGIITEVNTQTIARGLKDEPFPSAYMLSVMRELNIPVTLSSDAHSARAIDGGFSEALELLRCIGYKSVMMMKNGAFTEVEL